MRILQIADEIRYRKMNTDELRSTFLLSDIFQPGAVQLVYADLDRTVIGSVVPTESALSLPAPELLRAEYFTERRELGILNIGGPGAVVVNGERFELQTRDALYLGRGNREVTFESAEPGNPAEFYLLSYPAHAIYATTLIRAAEQTPVTLGTPESANRREITKLIYLAGARSCQLVMGFTRLMPGSVWNTMPAHTHMRRSEVYLYFDLPEQDRVIHLMGPAAETRHLIVANKQVVISPGWSVHSGAGTTNYSFCWGMGGENQVYDDMDKLAVSDLL